MPQDEYQIIEDRVKTTEARIDKLCDKWDEKFDKYNESISNKFDSIHTQLNNHINHISADISSINTKQADFSKSLDEIKSDFKCSSEKIGESFSTFKMAIMDELKNISNENKEDQVRAKVNATNINWLDKIVWLVAGGIATAVVLAATNHLIK